MSIQVFGHRALLEWWKPGNTSRIVQPDISGQHDVLRWGKVFATGDGRLDCSLREKLAGRGFSATEPITSLVKVGDRVCFEMTDIIKNTQVYKRWRDNKDMIHMLQTDIIGRVNGDEVNINTFEILGDFVLVKPEIRGTGSNIVLPNSAATSPEFVYYKVVQLGSKVSLPIKVGQEVMVNHGRVNLMYLSVTNPITGVRDNTAYGYIIQDYVHGCVDDDDVSLPG